MSTPDTVAVIAWADNTWQYLEDHDPEDYTHMSDDYAIIHVPADLDDEEVWVVVQAFNMGDLHVNDKGAMK